VTIGFVTLITLPLALMAITGVVQESAEKRQLAPFPSLGEADFSQHFDDWFSDHFGLRDTLVASYSRIKVFGMGVSTRKGVSVGKDDWLYYGANAMYATLGTIILPEAHMVAWRDYLEGVHDWLAERGVAYLFIITPSKQAIYPEHLPKGQTPVGPSTRQQMVDYLKTHSNLPFVDVTPRLLQKKSDGLLFLKSDSHWNALGAYYGYQAIMEKLSVPFPALAPRPLSDFTVTRHTVKGGDLSQLFNLSSAYTDTRVDLEPNTPRCATKKPFQLPGKAPWATHRQSTLTTCPSAPPISLLMLRDSFSNDMMPLLSEHFRRAIYLKQANAQHPLAHSPILLDAILREGRPALVLDQMSARKMLLNPPIVTNLHEASLRRYYREAPINKRWLAPNTPASQVSVSGPIQIEARANGLHIEVKGPGAKMTVGGVSIAQDQWPVVRIDLKASAATTLTLAYRGAYETAFPPSQSIQVAVAAGTNSLHLPLPQTGPISGLRLSFGAAPDTYTLRLLEARGVRRNFAILPNGQSWPAKPT